MSWFWIIGVALLVYLPYAIKTIWWDTRPAHFECYRRFANKIRTR